MNDALSIALWMGVAAPRLHEGGNETLATWKAALTTVLVVVALLQALSQAAVRGLAPAGRRSSWLGAHRILGLIGLGLVLLLSGLGLYALLVLDAPMESASRMVHAALGAVASVVLLAKVATSNRFRGQLRLNLPLGIAAFATIAALFAITAVPHLSELLAPEGMARLLVR